MDTTTVTAWAARIETACYDYLRERVGSPAVDAVATVARHRTRVAYLDRHPADAATIGLAVLLVAAVETLEPRLGTEPATALVSAAINEPFRDELLAATREHLDAVDDPYAALVGSSRERERVWFGPSFTFTRPVADDDTYVLDVRRCLYHEVLLALGRPELQEHLCRFDLSWADAVDPGRHGATVVRPVTFATGSRWRLVLSRVAP